MLATSTGVAACASGVCVEVLHSWPRGYRRHLRSSGRVCPEGLTNRDGIGVEMVASLLHGHGWTGSGPTALISDWQAVLANWNAGVLSSNLLRSNVP